MEGKRIRDAALSIFFYLFTFAAWIKNLIPEETHFSSGHMPVPNGQPCSIRLHAPADCKVSTSLTIYLMSSTKLQHCHQEHRQVSTGNCCRINGNKKISLKNKSLSDIFFDVYLLASRKRLRKVEWKF